MITPTSAPPPRQTWTAHRQSAVALLAAERAAGTSLGWQYLGGSAMLGARFRATGALRRVQLLLAVVAIPLAFWFGRIIGFSLVASIALAMGEVNIFAKAIMYRGQFMADDNALFMFIRGLPTEAQRVDAVAFGNEFKLVPSLLGPMLFVATPGFMALGGSMMGLMVVTFTSERELAGYEIAVCVAAVLSLLGQGANPLNMVRFTWFFVSSGQALARSIRENRIWDDLEEVDGDEEKGTANAKVDFAAAFTNYRIMKETLAGFTQSFQLFYFVAEFTLILCWIVAAFACFEQMQLYVAAPSTTALLMMLTVSGMVLASGSLIWGLACLAAEITDAAFDIHVQAHDLCARVAVQAPEQYQEAKQFYKHLEKQSHTIGFGFAGIVIKSGLIARICYGMLSAGFTVATLSLELYGK